MSMNTASYNELRKRDHRRVVAEPRIVLTPQQPNDQGVWIFAVASKSRPGTYRAVEVVTFGDTLLDPLYSISCPCQGFAHRRTCAHTSEVERVLIALGAMNDPLAQASPAIPDYSWATHIHGSRRAGETHVWLSDESGRAEALPHHVRHSPSGFEWNYGGSGPADLARSILIALTGNSAFADSCYQEFKRDVVAGLDLEGWTLSVDRVHAWVDARDGLAVAS